jgi:hypothetical protein
MFSTATQRHIDFVDDCSMAVTGKGQKFVIRERMTVELNSGRKGSV